MSENVSLLYLIVITSVFGACALVLVYYGLNLPNSLSKELVNEIEKNERTEKALLQSEIMYRTLVTTFPDAVIVTDLTGKITFASPGSVDLLGYQKESDLLHRNVLEFYQKNVGTNQDIILKKINEKESIRNEPAIMLNKSGKAVYVEISSSEIRNGDDNPEYYISTIRDISEKVKAANAKKESDELFRAIVNAANDFIFIKDKDLKYRMMNPQAIKFLGKDEAELIGKTDIDLFGKMIGNNVRKEDKRVLCGEIVDEEERRPINGQMKDVHVIKVPLRDAFGNITGLCGIARDITEKKNIERIIKAQKEEAQTYLDIANVIILALDFGGNIILINAKGAKILGYEKEELVGKNWVKNFIPQENKKQVGIVFSTFISGQLKIPEYYENAVLTKSGEKRIVAWHNSILKDDKGNVTGTLSSGEDITDNKQIQEALEKSEEMYRILVENANEAILVAQDGMLKFANSRTFSMLGYSEDEVLSTPFAEFIHSEDRDMVLNRHLKRIRGDHVPDIYDFRLITKTGEIKWIELNGIKISWENKPASLNFLSDVSARKEAERIKNVLYGISDSVNTTNDLIELSQSIKSQIGQILDTTNFYIALYDKSTDTISMPFFSDERDQFTSVPAAKTLTGYVIRTGQPLLAREDELQKLEDAGEIELVGTPSKIWLGVPLQSGNEMVGAVVVQSYTNPNLYTIKHLEILQFVSGQMAMALERRKGEEQIKSSLHEKELLLKEIHHRVKNNLQIIHSLLYLQAKKTTDITAHELFINSQNRVRSMALIHEKLYGSKDLSKVDFCEYTKSLTDHLRSIYKTEGKTINIIVNMPDIYLPIDTAIPCGLIVNELVSNSLKYAFPNGHDGKIDIEMISNNCNGKNGKPSFTLIVRDNGIGLPDDLDIKQTKSLGMLLVKNLTTQLDGDLERKSDNGAVVKIDFKMV